MRLTNQQISAITLAITPFIKEEKAELRLYGSRVNDNLRGGDIDLLLLVERSELEEMLIQKKQSMLSEIKKMIGDQKIDLIISVKNKINEDVFLKMIFPESVVLHHWF